jgi:hypothetical protein
MMLWNTEINFVDGCGNTKIRNEKVPPPPPFPLRADVWFEEKTNCWQQLSVMKGLVDDMRCIHLPSFKLSGEKSGN